MTESQFDGATQIRPGSIPPDRLAAAMVTAAEKGASGGVATLGADGKVPAGQLPTSQSGASPLTVARLTADVQSILIAQAPVTGLSFPTVANKEYEFDFRLAITSAALATGWQFGLTGPASPTYITATQEYQSSATAWAMSTIQAFGNFTLVQTAYAIAPARILVCIQGILVTGTTGGTVQLTFATEVATSAIVVKRGSTLKVT